MFTQGDFVPVTVIIPCFNSAETVARSVQSVLSQTVLPKQLILVDDASTDSGHTLAMLEALKRKAVLSVPNVEVVSLKVNGGAANARNVAWKRADQPYLVFLDADDAWHPDKLKIQYGWMSQHPAAVLTGHGTSVISSDKLLYEPDKELFVVHVSRRDILLRNVFPTRTVMIKRDLPLRFDPHMRRAEDYHLWLRVVLMGYPAYRMRTTLAFSYKEDFGAGGLSAALWKMEQAELGSYTKLTKLGLISWIELPFLWCWSLMKYARRWILGILV